MPEQDEPVSRQSLLEDGEGGPLVGVGNFYPDERFGEAGIQITSEKLAKVALRFAVDARDTNQRFHQLRELSIQKGFTTAIIPQRSKVLFREIYSITIISLDSYSIDMVI
jgi:hypothetical protein